MAAERREALLLPSVLEAWVLEYLEATKSRGMVPPIRVVRRDTTNARLLVADEDDEGGPDRLRLGSKTTEKVLGASKSYVGVLLTVSFCHKLLCSRTTATQRELYYYYKGGDWSPWATQAECNESIADVATLFGVPRYALGLTTAARGSVAGRLRVRRAAGGWTDLRAEPQMIGHEWLTERKVVRSDARCVVVVEKDGVFRRLVEDRFYERYPCVLVTGCGVPDLPTRACVHRLRQSLKLPVYGLVDWNVWGLGILLTYKLGSARLGLEAHQFAVDAAWLGLRTSQVGDVPAEARQPLTDRDRRRGESLLQSDWIQAHPAWAREVKAQLDAGAKCELEALLQGDMGRIADFVETAITSCDYLPSS